MRFSNGGLFVSIFRSCSMNVEGLEIGFNFYALIV